MGRRAVQPPPSMPVPVQVSSPRSSVGSSTRRAPRCSAGAPRPPPWRGHLPAPGGRTGRRPRRRRGCVPQRVHAADRTRGGGLAEVRHRDHHADGVLTGAARCRDDVRGLDDLGLRGHARRVEPLACGAGLLVLRRIQRDEPDQGHEQQDSGDREDHPLAAALPSQPAQSSAHSGPQVGLGVVGSSARRSGGAAPPRTHCSSGRRPGSRRHNAGRTRTEASGRVPRPAALRTASRASTSRDPCSRVETAAPYSGAHHPEGLRETARRSPGNRRTRAERCQFRPERRSPGEMRRNP